jgi:hypothetical protein
MVSEIVAHLASLAIGGGAEHFRNIFALDHRLTGRWEGDLECTNKNATESRTHVIRCILVLARPIARPNSGLLYYQKECTATDKILVRGLDELKKYKRVKGYFRPKEIAMEFTRRFHKYPSGEVDESAEAYKFQGKFEGLFSRAPALDVETRIKNNKNGSDVWCGTLQKH